MEVILLERIARLGQMGDVVRVRDGYARNFLLPQGKALRANKANMAQFESQRAQLEARNLERKTEAAAVAEKLDGQAFIVIRSAGDTGQLYGSVSTRDVADLVSAGGFSILRTQVQLNAPIKTLGVHKLKIALHPEVDASITVNIARTEDEAERQARGEDVSIRRSEYEMEPIVDEDEMFDEDARARREAESEDAEAAGEEASPEA